MTGSGFTSLNGPKIGYKLALVEQPTSNKPTIEMSSENCFIYLSIVIA